MYLDGLGATTQSRSVSVAPAHMNALQLYEWRRYHQPATRTIAVAPLRESLSARNPPTERFRGLSRSTQTNPTASYRSAAWFRAMSPAERVAWAQQTFSPAVLSVVPMSRLIG